MKLANNLAALRRVKVQGFVLAALLVSFAVIQTAYAKTYDLVIPFLVDGESVGSMPVAITYPDNSFTVLIEDLLPPLKRIGVKESVLSEVAEKYPSGTRVSTKELEPFGLDLRYDAAQIAIALATNNTLGGGGSIALRNRRAGFPTLPNIIPGSDVSGYFNIRYTGVYAHDGVTAGADKFSHVVGLDSALRLFGPVLEFEGVYDARAETNFRRQHTRLLFNDAENELQYSFGDLRSNSFGTAGRPRIMGFGLQKDIQKFSPYKTITPLGETSFELDEQSFVDVYVNGRKVEQLRLRPGAYNVQDFPFYDGINDVELKIRGDSGREDLVQFSQYFSYDLLEPGVFEFDFAAGLETISGGELEYNEDNIVVAAGGHLGISNTLTGLAEFRVEDGFRFGELGMITGLPAASVRLSVLGSDTDMVGTGVAADIDIDFEEIAGVRFDLSAFAADESFRISPRGGSGQQYRLAVRGTSKLGERTSIGAAASWNRSFLGASTAVYSANFGQALGPSLNMSTTAQYRQNDFGSGLGRNNEWSVFASLFWRPGSNWWGRATYRSERQQASLNGNYRSTNRGIGAYSADIDIDRDDSGDVSIGGGFDYTANRFQARVAHGVLFSDVGAQNAVNTTSINVDTALAFADGAVAIGRRVSDSFVIVQADETIGGRQVVVGEYEEEIARTDFLGAALVPQGSSYRVNQIQYDVPTIEAGVDIGMGIVNTIPQEAQGYLLSVSARGQVSLIGNLVDDTDEPIGYASGYLQQVAPSQADADATEKVEIISNKTGKFAAIGLKSGTSYELTLRSRTYKSRTIKIADDARGTVKLARVQLDRSGSFATAATATDEGNVLEAVAVVRPATRKIGAGAFPTFGAQSEGEIKSDVAAIDGGVEPTPDVATPTTIAAAVPPQGSWWKNASYQQRLDTFVNGIIGPVGVTTANEEAQSVQAMSDMEGNRVDQLVDEIVGEVAVQSPARKYALAQVASNSGSNVAKDEPDEDGEHSDQSRLDNFLDDILN